MNGRESRARVKYGNPPIQEAVCEVRFSLTSPLGKNDIERIQPVWKAEYPNQQVVAEKSVRVNLSVDKVDTESTEVGHKLITRSADGKNLAQLGPTFIAVNRLRPYSGWAESFREIILARIGEAKSVYALKEIERVGLRYVNRIDFPEKALRWSEWFVVALPVPGGLGDRGGNFQFHFEQRLTENIHAIVNFLSLPTPSGFGTSVILDIDVSWKGKENIDTVVELLEQVHDPHHMLFEGYLLDRTRDLFQIRK